MADRDPIVTALRERRRQLGLSQSMLARRLRMSRSGVARLEWAGQSPSLATLRPWASALGCSLELVIKAATR